MSWNSSLTKHFSDNQMNFNTITDGVVIFAIAATLILFDAIQELLSIFKKGVFIDQRELLLKKTNKELKAMLVGMKKISNLKKKDLVELVLIAN